MESPEFDIYPIVAQGMGPDLHWCLEDVQLGELAATLAALANTSGGTIFIGINPKSGQIQGVQDIPTALDRVFQACLFVEPTLVIPVPGVKQVGQVEILHISVPQGLPHVFSLEGRYSLARRLPIHPNSCAATAPTARRKRDGLV